MRSASLVLAALSCIAVASTNAACSHGSAADIRKDDPTGASSGLPGDGSSGGGQPGSRLVPLTFVGNDGSKAFTSWFDKGIKRECAFERIGPFVACVPSDVYSVDVNLFGDSYKTANPALFTDPACTNRKAIALDEQTQCLQYGVIRFKSAPSEFPSCGASAYGAGLAVITPVPAGTKVYKYGVPAGGGACCSCNEWTPREGSTLRAYFVETYVTEEHASTMKLVTGKIDIPTGP